MPSLVCLLLAAFGCLPCHAQYWSFLFSPLPLRSSWWEPDPGAHPPQLDCAQRNKLVKSECPGKFNNHLLCSISSMQSAMSNKDALWVMSHMTDKIFSLFDHQSALSGWLCYLSWRDADKLPNIASNNIAANRDFWEFDRSSVLFHARYAIILGQLFRRPGHLLRSALQNTRLFHVPYVGLHLRDLDGACQHHMADACDSFSPARLQSEIRYAHSTWSICNMSNEYVHVHAVLHRLGGHGLPWYVAHDGSEFALLRLADLTAQFNVTTRSPLPRMPPNSHLDVVFDQLMLINSRIFIGNPASTFSGTVANVRYSMFNEAKEQAMHYTNVIWPGGCAGFRL